MQKFVPNVLLGQFFDGSESFTLVRVSADIQSSAQGKSS